PVLGHLDLASGATNIASELGHVGDREPGIVSDDDHAGLGDSVVKRRNDFALLCSIHSSLRQLRGWSGSPSPLTTPCRKKRGWTAKAGPASPTALRCLSCSYA